MRRPCPFTETALRRVLRAAQKEHVPVQINLMPDGCISIVPAAAPDVTTTITSGDVNEWDEPKL